MHIISISLPHDLRGEDSHHPQFTDKEMRLKKQSCCPHPLCAPSPPAMVTVAWQAKAFTEPLLGANTRPRTPMQPGISSPPPLRPPCRPERRRFLKRQS